MTGPRRAPQGTGGETRAALVAAGLHVFGARGFEAASTRQIAARANTNIASIAYHFGGKEGLRLACAEEIASRMGQVARLDAPPPGRAGPDAALARIELMLTAMARFIIGQPQASDVAAFMLREMAAPSPALDRIYEAMIRPVHLELCRLWAAATGGDAASEETRLRVFAIIGQVLYFRIGRPVVMQRMDWPGIGPQEADRITAVLVDNLRALARAAREQHT